MLRKNLLRLISLLSLAGCAQVEIRDHEWCTIAGLDGAYCFHTLSDKERDLTKEEFEALSLGWLAGSPEAYGNLKEAVEKLCSGNSKCTYEEVQAFKAFFFKVEEGQARILHHLPLIEE